VLGSKQAGTLTFFANSDNVISSRIAQNKEKRLDQQRSLVLPTYPVSMCLVCKHYRKAQRCEAFPARIPQAILTGRFDHRKRHDGDRGIRFQPRDDVSQAELESILSIFDKKTAF
jgi:hypothetical protein